MVFAGGLAGVPFLGEGFFEAGDLVGVRRPFLGLVFTGVFSRRFRFQDSRIKRNFVGTFPLLRTFSFFRSFLATLDVSKAHGFLMYM